MSPVLSITIPTYNRVNYLKVMLNSVISEIERDNLSSKVEIIVSDNCSDDGTKEYMLSMLDKPYISYSRNEKNIGAIKNIIKLATLVKGKYWMFYGDDDSIYEGSLIKILSAFEENPDIALFIFKQKGYGKINQDKITTIYNAVSEFFYYMGNACSSAKTDNIKEHIEKYYDEISSTCWPQTHLMLLAAYASDNKHPVMISTVTVYVAQKKDNNNVIDASYMYYAPFYSLVRLAYLVSNETEDKEFVKHAVKGIRMMNHYSAIFFALDSTFVYHFLDLPKAQLEFKKLLNESKSVLKGTHKYYAYISILICKIPVTIFKFIYIGLNSFRMSMRGVKISESYAKTMHMIKHGREEKIALLARKHTILKNRNDW